nr:MAG TPA: hypothetical protein [Inoviridae sp.]
MIKYLERCYHKYSVMANLLKTPGLFKIRF